MAGKIRGWILDTIWKFKVSDGTERTVFDEAGYLYQRNTKLTATATALNAITAGVATNAVADEANKAVLVIDGSTGKKACAVNGVTLITGGTGIADLTLAAPTVGAVATIRVASLSSGDVVITTAAGVTFDGTNNTATLNAADEGLVLYRVSATAWAIAQNIGGVVLSAVT